MVRRVDDGGARRKHVPRMTVGRPSVSRRSSAANTTLQSRWSSLVVFAVAAIATVVLLGGSGVYGKEITGLGFYPPFQTFNARGDRTVSSWTLANAGVVKQSFARLTPDLPSSSGNMFSRLTGRFNTGPPGGQFSVAMTFRVSGEHERAHGNFLALVVGNPELIRRKGDTYGLPENFVGVGVVISPRAPADMSEIKMDPARPAGPRQFVSFIANNGTRTTADVRVLANSCASTLRYHQGRDDFSFLKSSRVRLGFYDGQVTLEMDARNIGVWRKCITTRITDMPAGWLDRAGVALTAETGTEVSNNHDVMSLEVFTERDEGFNKNVVDGGVVDEEGGDEAAEAAAKEERLRGIRAHLEHEFDSVERILKDSLAKLANVNEDMRQRLTKVEKDVSMEVFAVLNKRVRGIEERVKTNAMPALEVRIQDVQDDFQDEVGESMKMLLGQGTGWKYPFFVALAILASLFAFYLKQYRRLMQANFLGGMR